MSANFYFRPKNDRMDLTVMSTNEFTVTMDLTFGGFPIDLNRSVIGQLNAMSSLYTANGFNTDDNPYKELIEAVEQFGSIIVEREG